MAYFHRILSSNADIQQVETSEETMLKDLQQAVGGYIERVYLKGEFDHSYMIVNEEGLLEHQPVQNIMASAIAGQPIVGDVAIIRKEFFT